MGAMPSLSGSVRSGSGPAAGAYVQLRNLDDDFLGEVRADSQGCFKLYTIAGSWRLLAWMPGDGRAQQDVDVAASDVDLAVDLA